MYKKHFSTILITEVKTHDDGSSIVSINNNFTISN